MPSSTPPSTPTPNPTCPFCAIALANPPSSSPLSPIPPPSSTSTPPPAHIILSTPHLLAFLDHAPISRGHVLVVVRAHREKLDEVRVREGEALGRCLGVVSRAVVGAVSDEGGKGGGKRERGENRDGGIGGRDGGEGEGEEDVDVGDWNVVQNNEPSIPRTELFLLTIADLPRFNLAGARAAQVVPHVHFHIIPRVGDDVPEVKARSWTVFGKGQREELDEEDAVALVGRMRERLRGEVERVGRREGEGAVRRLFAGGDGEEGAGGGDGRERGSKL